MTAELQRRSQVNLLENLPHKANANRRKILTKLPIKPWHSKHGTSGDNEIYRLKTTERSLEESLHCLRGMTRVSFVFVFVCLDPRSDLFTCSETNRFITQVNLALCPEHNFTLIVTFFLLLMCFLADEHTSHLPSHRRGLALSMPVAVKTSTFFINRITVQQCKYRRVCVLCYPGCQWI